MKLILGGPGCGKTHYLLDTVEKELASGVRPDQIAFLAFTRKAAWEAQERAAKRFNIAIEELPHFRTLHSFAFRQLGINPNQVMSVEDYKVLGKHLGVEFGACEDEDQFLHIPDKVGDQYAYIEQMSRLTLLPLEQACLRYGRSRPKGDVVKYALSLKEYKRSRGVFDYTDMLERFVNGGGVIPSFKVVIIDEAQDLCPLQWRMVERIVDGVQRVYIGGDDDQAIYEWSGADVKYFLNLKAERLVLPVSHRLSRAVFDHANKVVNKIRHRFEKKWDPASEGGTVEYHRDASDVDLSQNTWYLLARNRYMLTDYVLMLRERGYPFVYRGRSTTDNDSVRALVAYEKLRKGEAIQHCELKIMASKLQANAMTVRVNTVDREKMFVWNDLGMKISQNEDWMFALTKILDKEREYYRTILRRKESLLKAPRITVNTIHQVKGGEADNVLIFQDMSYACYQELLNNPDSEHRVFYVGATRARTGLHIIHRRTNKAFNL